MNLSPLARALIGSSSRNSPVMTAYFDRYQYRPSVPLVEVHFLHIDAINLTTGDAVYGTVNAVQLLTTGFNVVSLKIGQVTLKFGLHITPQGIDYRNRDLEDATDPSTHWTIREIRSRITYNTQTFDHRQKPLFDPVKGGHPKYEIARRR